MGKYSITIKNQEKRYEDLVTGLELEEAVKVYQDYIATDTEDNPVSVMVVDDTGVSIAYHLF